MKILVTGAAGYIGSHMAKWLVRSGHEVVIFDNFSTGFPFLARYGTVFEGDLNDADALARCFAGGDFDAVIHFAARSLVGESVQAPLLYYQNNVAGTVNLLDAMQAAGVRRLIFSSTAAVYGTPETVPIVESAPTQPINPYGRSKRMMEQVIEDAVAAYGFDAVSLRYFNAAGADPEGEVGECHDPETHLIPLVLQAALGQREAITIYGENYPTADGTCVRDYIHVWDLVAAHAAALESLAEGRLCGYAVFNLGIGQGYSVREVIETCRRVVKEDGCEIPVRIGSRRAGDPPVLVADSRRAQQTLNWQPCLSDLETIVRHAWAWARKRA